MLETYVVHVTKKCNCDCFYCYEDDKTSEYTWGEIKDLIDNMVKYNKKFNLEFLGGEPCLRMDLIEMVVEVYNEYVNNFIITTNGTIVNDDLIELLLENDNVTWAASIDGHHFANSLRVFKDGTNTHDVVISNLQKLLDSGVKNNQINCHLVTHHYNVAYLFDSVVHLYDQGFRNFGIGTIESKMTIDDRYCNSFKSQMMKLSRHIHAGLLPDIQVNELISVKPRSDRRHYIYDDTGKVVGETYGRENGDIVSQDIDGIKSVEVFSDVSDKIYHIREFSYDYHQSYTKVYGCGTGRCGSKTLAKYITSKYKFSTIHESIYLKWFCESEEENIRKILDHHSHQVSAVLIRYADTLLSTSNCIFVCVKRDKDDFIRSFMRSHLLDDNSTWGDIPNADTYPKLIPELDIISGLSEYWDMYYKNADVLHNKWGDRFEIIDFKDLIKVKIPDDIKYNGNGFYDYGEKLVETLI